MPKFTTKIYYKSEADLRTLKNIAALSRGPKGKLLRPEESMVQFVNEAVQAYANSILHHIKVSKEKEKADAIQEAANAPTSTEPSGIAENTPEGSPNSATLADEEEAAAENTPGH